MVAQDGSRTRSARYSLASETFSLDKLEVVVTYTPLGFSALPPVCNQVMMVEDLCGTTAVRVTSSRVNRNRWSFLLATGLV